jgi:hypothetical protein
LSKELIRGETNEPFPAWLEKLSRHRDRPRGSNHGVTSSDAGVSRSKLSATAFFFFLQSGQASTRFLTFLWVEEEEKEEALLHFSERKSWHCSIPECKQY